MDSKSASPVPHTRRTLPPEKTTTRILLSSDRGGRSKETAKKVQKCTHHVSRGRT